MAAENRFVLIISFNGIKGILKDNTLHKTKKCSKKVVKLFDNLLFINNLFDNLLLTSYSYELQAKSDKLQFPRICSLILHDHKQQLTFLRRFKLIRLYPA